MDGTFLKEETPDGNHGGSPPFCKATGIYFHKGLTIGIRSPGVTRSPKRKELSKEKTRICLK